MNNRSQKVEAVAKRCVQIVAVFVALIYAALFLEKEYFARQIGGEISVLEPSFTPPWYRMTSIFSSRKAKVDIGEALLVEVEPGLDRDFSGDRVKAGVGDYSGLIYSLRSEGKTWEFFSLKKLFLMLLLLLVLVPVVNELSLVYLVSFLAASRLIFYVV